MKQTLSNKVMYFLMVLGFGLMVLAPSAKAAQTVTAVYQGLSGEISGTCSATYNIWGQKPDGAGPFPVHVHIVGTNESYTSGPAQTVISEMVKRGFLAVTIDYPHNTDDGCSALQNKMACMFNASAPTSALAAICALPGADCNRGITTSGISQGAQIATMAKNYDSRVQAVYGMGDGDVVNVGSIAIDMHACMDPGTRSLPNDRLRAINGEADQFLGTTSTGVGTQLNAITGQTCDPAATSCLRGNGSGWYKVLNSEVQNPPAGHVYIIDPGWDPPYTYPWSLITNANWLASFIAPASTPTPPAAPAGAVLTGPSASSLVFSWQPVTGATGYRVDVALDSGFAQQVGGFANLDAGNQTSLAITALSPATVYYARVRAYNSAGTSGNSGTASASTMAQTGGAAPIINFFTASPNSVSAGQSATLSWSVSANPAATLTIDNGIGTVSGSSVTVSPTTPITYTLTATNSNGSATARVTISIIVPNPVPPPSGTPVLRLINAGGTFYLIQNGVRHGITNPGMLFSYGLEFKDAVTAGASDLALPLGEILQPGDGALVRSQEDQTVYLVSNRQRYGFVSAQVFFALGFNFSSVLVVTNPELQALPRAVNLSNPTAAHLPGLDINRGGTIYWIGQDGQLHGYPSVNVYNSWHVDNNFSQVVPANAADAALFVGSNVDYRVLQ